MENRRVFSRVQFATNVKIGVHPDFTNRAVIQVHDGEMLDISLKGALIRPAKHLRCEMGQEIDLSFFLPSSDVTLTFKAIVAHKHAEKLGLKFICEDLDTLTHLRRLVELNLGDHEKVERELPFLIDDDE